MHTNKDTVDTILPWLNEMDTILDLGSGTGIVSFCLSEQGHKTVPIDVSDQSLVGVVRPIVYDGMTIPFADKTFDTVIVLSVLHHTQNPEHVLSEVIRVGHRVIVKEDIIIGPINRVLTHTFDSVLNSEYIGHPHSNRSDLEWQETFARLRMKIATVVYLSSPPVFKHAIYMLETASYNPLT